MQIFEQPMMWNLFGRKPEFNVWCAVPSELALPAFLFTGAWIFGGQRLDAEGGLPGLGRRVALHGAWLNGFYMFHTFAAASDPPTA